MGTDKEYIEKGRLARMERGISMQVNDSLNFFARKLQRTREEINRRKANDTRPADQVDEITKLERQNSELQDSIREMKQKKQVQDGVVLGSSSAAMPKPKRKGF